MRPTSDRRVMMVLLYNLVRVRYRAPEAERLRRESVAYCAREIARQQRAAWGLPGGEDNE